MNFKHVARITYPKIKTSSILQIFHNIHTHNTPYFTFTLSVYYHVQHSFSALDYQNHLSVLTTTQLFRPMNEKAQINN